MPVGLSEAIANSMLSTIGDPYIQMHFGDPGADGTSNVAAVSQRAVADLKAPILAARTLEAVVEWPEPWAGGAQTVTHITAWDAPTGGTLLFSASLATQVDFVDGMIPRLVALAVSIASIAAD